MGGRPHKDVFPPVTGTKLSPVLSLASSLAGNTEAWVCPGRGIVARQNAGPGDGPWAGEQASFRCLGIWLHDKASQTPISGISSSDRACHFPTDSTSGILLAQVHSCTVNQLMLGGSQPTLENRHSVPGASSCLLTRAWRKWNS